MKRFIVAAVLVAALAALQFAIPQASVVHQDRFTWDCTDAVSTTEIIRIPTIQGDDWASTLYVYINADALGGAGAITITAFGGMNNTEACLGSLSVATPGMIGSPVVQACTTSSFFTITPLLARINNAPMALPPFVALKLTVHNARSGSLVFDVIAGSP